MLIRVAILAVLGLLCAAILLPVTGDASTARWLTLAATAGIGVPFAVWGTVRLLWAAKTQAAAWTAFALAALTQLGLLVAAFTVLDVGAKDIGTAVGRAARGEGLPPGTLRGGVVGSGVALQWARAVGTAKEDTLQAVAVDEQGRLYAAGVLGGGEVALDGSAAQGGSLAVLVFDREGQELRRHLFPAHGRIEVVALAPGPEGGLLLAARNEAEVELDGETYGKWQRMTGLLLGLDEEGEVGFAAELPADELHAAPVGPEMVLFGRSPAPFTVGDEEIGGEGLFVTRVEPDGSVVAAKHLPGQRSSAAALAVGREGVAVIARLSLPNSRLGLGESPEGVSNLLTGATHRGSHLVLLNDDLQTVGLMPLGDHRAYPSATRGLPDGDYLIAVELQPEQPLLGEGVTPVGFAPVGLARVEPDGEVRWRQALGFQSKDAADRRPIHAAADPGGVLLVTSSRPGLAVRGPGKKLIDAPAKERDDLTAVRLDPAGEPAFVESLVVSGELLPRAVVSAPSTVLVAGSFVGEVQLKGPSLSPPPAADDDEAASAPAGFFTLGRLE